MRENIVIKRNDENLKYIVISYEWKEISVADLLDEYEKLIRVVFLIKSMETFTSQIIELNDMLKKIRSSYEDNQNA